MEYNKNHPLRVATLASGYDAQCLGLERLKEIFPEFDYQLKFWAEWDPESNQPIEKQPAVIAHKALFPQWADRNQGDLTKIPYEDMPDIDLLFASTPCQSISQAGLQHGFARCSGTRSSIIWNVHDCVRAKKPLYIVMENVAAILSGKFLPLLQLWLKELENMGYKNFMPPVFDMSWNGQRTKRGCLNTRNYGVPQNRERWFCISILRTEDNPEPKFNFPAPFKLEKCLKDVLEEDVDERFFLSDDMLARFCEKSLEENTSTSIDNENIPDEDLENWLLFS